jgi:hypothetical protein
MLNTDPYGWRLPPDRLALADLSIINKQEQMRFAGFAPEPYERLGAKLAIYVRVR